MRKILLSLSVIGLLFFISSCQTNEDTTNEIKNVDNVIPGQYIVVLNQSSFKSLDGVKYQERLDLVKAEAVSLVAAYNIEGVAVERTYGTALRGFSAKLSEEEANLLAKDERVKYIMPDKTFNLEDDMQIFRGGGGGGGGGGIIVPVDPPAQTIPYGIIRVGYGDGTGKTAWIIDTGVDLDHPDLIVDAARGYDFINNDAYADDDNGHGSHCAGTVAGVNNTIGVVGVAAGATIVPVKVLDNRGSGAYSVIIAGVDFVAANAAPGDAVNMSLGGGVYEPIDDAVVAASNNGILFALAAGNESDDANNHSPARANSPYIWTISAMDINDNFAYFSNYGNPPIEYCMPGVDIYSTHYNGGFTTMSGTSMAAPHMCGVLLMTGGNPSTDGYVNGDPDGDADPIAHL